MAKSRHRKNHKTKVNARKNKLKANENKVKKQQRELYNQIMEEIKAGKFDDGNTTAIDGEDLDTGVEDATIISEEKDSDTEPSKED
jgi:hypothetical protein